MATSHPAPLARAPLVPPLEPDFVPVRFWRAAYARLVAATPGARSVDWALCRPDGTVFRETLRLLPAGDRHAARNWRYFERRLKEWLWVKGGNRVLLAGAPEIAARLASCYSATGARAFDAAFFGDRVFGGGFSVAAVEPAALPPASEAGLALGGHRAGCRVGFDLGGSDRKCAALIDGAVVFSEEVRWDPYFQTDPEYHRAGIRDSIRRAAAHLPRVDAIGGSAAGIYVNNEVRAASLFRGLSPAAFDRRIRHFFSELQAEWGGVPVAVVNDGEVTALAASLAGARGAVLGVAMGTSTAAGYVRPNGHLTCWLNELAFVPVDYQDAGPVDEWSGDAGCAVQYFSQQGVARLAARAGMDRAADEALPDFLERVQAAMDAGDPRAREVFTTIGMIFGYALLDWLPAYGATNVLLLGRVLSGTGGAAILASARDLCQQLEPALAASINWLQPDERDKRHGQAIAAASLVEIMTND